MIQPAASKLHWNYFLALERDLEVVSRYIEFCPANFSTYSIELAHLLFAAASEVDVIAKSLCQILSPVSPCKNIDQYRTIITNGLPTLPAIQIFVPRYGHTLTPWDNWAHGTNPDWWHSYNNVKHERNKYFHEATLKNALNALGALLILIFYYYSYTLSQTSNKPLDPKNTTRELEPQSELLRLHEDMYYSHLIV